LYTRTSLALPFARDWTVLRYKTVETAATVPRAMATMRMRVRRALNDKPFGGRGAGRVAPQVRTLMSDRQRGANPKGCDEFVWTGTRPRIGCNSDVARNSDSGRPS
jgi:hypothetical protein